MTLAGPYFDRLYDADVDPWGFRSRWYEARKRAITVASLTRKRYRVAFEPGCSIGVLTQGLADRCDRVLAMDIAGRALAEAAKSVPGNVELRAGAIPDDWPPGRFDLVVLSELAYYHDRPSCRRLADLAATSGAELVAVHWRHPVADYPLTGDEAHAIVAESAASAGLEATVSHVERDFRLESWCADPRSVAARSGMAVS